MIVCEIHHSKRTLQLFLDILCSPSYQALYVDEHAEAGNLLDRQDERNWSGSEKVSPIGRGILRSSVFGSIGMVVSSKNGSEPLPISCIVRGRTGSSSL